MKNTKQKKQEIGQSGLKIHELGPEWNDRLIKLTKNSPVKAGNLRILFDRSPDIFAIPRLTSYKSKCLGLFKDNKLLGYAFVSYQKRYVNQKVTDVIYLGNMHVFQQGLGSVFLKLLSDRVTHKLLESTKVKMIYAYVAEKNFSAMKLADPGYFSSQIAGKITMSNILLLPPKLLHQKYNVRKAQPADIDDMVALLKNEYKRQLLAPEINREIFLQILENRPQFNIENYFLATWEDEIVGVCAVWDMTHLKQNRIVRYSPLLQILRIAYNFGAILAGTSLLPQTGKSLNDVTITEYAVKNRDPEIMEALLRHVYNHFRSRGYHSIILGGSANDRLLEATQSFLKTQIRSNVIVTSLRSKNPFSVSDSPLIYADAVQI